MRVALASSAKAPRSPAARCPAASCRLNLAIAISAPVLPADTATSASPFLTASMASHIDDFQRPLRSAWLGLSSIRTATSVCTSRAGRLELRMGGEQRLDHGLVAEQDERAVGMLRQRQRRARQRPPRVHGHPPWRRARCGPSGAWIDLNTGDGSPGNSVFGNDRVKIDNSLPAGGRTSGYHVAVSARSRRNSAFFGVSPFFRAASAANGCSTGRPPAAHRTPRRACGDRDRFPEAETRWPPRRDRPCHS